MTEAKQKKVESDHTESLDDRGTTETEGLELLRRLRDDGFDGDNERLATALGRPSKTVEAWMEGAESLDDDIIMKARGIATQRGVEVD
jgi:hypothetical protein